MRIQDIKTRLKGSKVNATRSGQGNCFRISELGIPNHADVVVLGKPQMTLGSHNGGNDIIIGLLTNPLQLMTKLTTSVLLSHFKRPHHRQFNETSKGSLQAYLGFAGMG